MDESLDAHMKIEKQIPDLCKQVQEQSDRIWKMEKYCMELEIALGIHVTNFNPCPHCSKDDLGHWTYTCLEPSVDNEEQMPTRCIAHIIRNLRQTYGHPDVKQLKEQEKEQKDEKKDAEN